MKTIRSLFLALAALMPSALANALQVAVPKKRRDIGLQLWTVNQALSRDFKATIETLVEIGYRRFEGYGYRDGLFFGRTPVELREFLAGAGARMTSTHTDIPWNDGRPDIEQARRAMADAAESGCQWLIQPYYQIDRTQGIDGVKRLADHYNLCGGLARAEGLRFGYHNLTQEFEPLEGEIPYEVLLGHTDPELVSFQIDTVQLVTAGYVCHEYVRRFPGRFGTWHIKDTPAGRRGNSCDLGRGVVDFGAIFAAAKIAGMDDFYVEQEDFDRDPFDCLRADYEFIDKL